MALEAHLEPRIVFEHVCVASRSAVAAFLALEAHLGMRTLMMECGCGSEIVDGD